VRHFRQAFVQGLVERGILTFHQLQLMRQIKRRHDRNSVGAGDLAGVPHLAHLNIELPRRLNQVALLVGCAGNFVFLAHNGQRYRLEFFCS